jgi:hypothetical protein
VFPTKLVLSSVVHVAVAMLRHAASPRAKLDVTAARILANQDIFFANLKHCRLVDIQDGHLSE